MRKRFAFILLAALLAAIFGIAACSPTEESVNLVDFPATKTEESELGSTYQLRRIVEDDEGNAYPLTVSVKTKAGAEVQVTMNQFVVTVIDGYTITYSAVIKEGVTKTCVVTLNVKDTEPPQILIGDAKVGVVGREYTLPAITIEDLAGIAESSVELFFVEGTELTEITLTESDGRYKFTPQQKGIYRIRVYAKDTSGRENTVEKEFTADNMLPGEIFNPAAFGAREQFYSSKDPDAQFSFVSDEENEDTTYGGPYMRVVPPSTGWINLYLTPRLDLSEYEEYDYVFFWFHVEYPAQGGMMMAILNDDDLKAEFSSNTWVLKILPMDKFIEKVETQYFCAINFYDANSAIRVGEITTKKDPKFTITGWDIGQGTLTEKAMVKFTVDSEFETTPQYTLTVKDSSGQEIAFDSKQDDQFTFKLFPGVYTYTVSPTEDSYYGDLTGQFEVFERTKIVLEDEYPRKVKLGDSIDILDGKLLVEGKVEDADVNCSLSFMDYETGQTTDVTGSIVNGKYTFNARGKLTITYSYENLLDKVCIVDTYLEGEVWNPASEGALDQFRANGTMNFEFVSVTENNDPVYGKAYWKSQSPTPIGWRNFYLTPSFNLDAYDEYDYLCFWIYVGYPTTGTFNLALFNDSAYEQQIITNTWTRIVVNMQGYRNYYTANQGSSGNPYFMAATFGSQLSAYICLGEVVGLKGVNYTATEWEIGDGLITAPATVKFTVSSDVQPIPAYTVTVKDSGENAIAYQQKDGDRYTYSLIPGLYTYTITCTGEGYYGTFTGQFEVLEKSRIVIDGEYPVYVQVESVIDILDGKISEQGVIGDKVASYTLKHYNYKTGAETDVTSSVSDKQYTANSTGKLKITYVYNELLPLECVIYIVDSSLEGEYAFDPDEEGAINRLSSNKASTFTYVSDAENDDPVYGGSYWKMTPPSTGWCNFFLDPIFDSANYIGYEYIAMWVYIKSSAEPGLMYLPVFNQYLHREAIMTNTWTRLLISSEYFAANMDNSNQVFLTASFGTITDIYLGKVVGYFSSGKQTVEIFDPETFTSTPGSGLFYTNKDTAEPAAQYEFVSDEANDDETYGGAYWKITPPSTGWINFYLKPAAVNSYLYCENICFWIYVANDSVTEGSISVAILNESSLGKTVQYNTWTKITLNAAHFIERVGGQYFFAINLPVTDGVYIGEVWGEIVQ